MELARGQPYYFWVEGVDVVDMVDVMDVVELVDAFAGATGDDGLASALKPVEGRTEHFESTFQKLPPKKQWIRSLIQWATSGL